MRAWFSLPAAGAALLVFASCASREPDSREIYSRTLEHLDEGGEYLHFSNTAERNRLIAKFYNEVFDIFASDIARLKIDPAAALKPLNPGAIKAEGMSACRLDSGVWQFKSFLYTIEAPAPGVMSLEGSENVAFPELDNLPESTIFATGGHCRAAVLWRLFSQICETQPNPQISGLPEKCEKYTETNLGIALDKLLAALDGNYNIIVSGQLTAPGYFASFPDRGGVLAKLIRERCGMDAKADRVSWPGPFPVGCIPAPTLLLGDEKLTVYGGGVMAEIAAAKKSGGLLKTPEFAAYARGLSREGTGYVVVNLPVAEALELVADRLPDFEKRDRVIAAAMKIRPLRIFGVSTMEDDGYLTIMRSDYSLPALVEAYPFIAGPMFFTAGAMRGIAAATENSGGETAPESL